MYYTSKTFNANDEFLETFNIVMDSLSTNFLNPNNLYHKLDQLLFNERKRVNTAAKLITSVVNNFVTSKDNAIILDSGHVYPRLIIENYSLSIMINGSDLHVLTIRQMHTKNQTTYNFEFCASNLTLTSSKLQSISHLTKKDVFPINNQPTLERGDPIYRSQNLKNEKFQIVTADNVINDKTLNDQYCSLQEFESYEHAAAAGIYYRRMCNCIPELDVLVHRMKVDDIQTWNLDYVKKRWRGMLNDAFRMRNLKKPDYIFDCVCPDLSKKYPILVIVVNTKYEYMWVLTKTVSLQVLPLSIFIDKFLITDEGFDAKKFKKKLCKCFDSKSEEYKIIKAIIKKEIRMTKFTFCESNCRI